MRTPKTAKAGFSLLELMIVITILLVVMAVVFGQVAKVQSRYKGEETKVDLTQESREFLDQLVRDIAQCGYPTSHMYDKNVLALIATPTLPVSPSIWGDHRYAVGIKTIQPWDIFFEGDVDGTGVSNLRYRLHDVNGNVFSAASPACSVSNPCTLKRAQVGPKPDGDPFNSTIKATVASNYSVELQNVVSSTIFTAYTQNGTVVALPQDISTKAGQDAIKTISTIRVSISVQSNVADVQTGIKPTIFMGGTARINNISF